ncbi:hypothetical protein [Saccharothrix sp. HUAS TT1]|uniref:hypothetical protein n=1 Tax=unclassified Saccharothrix TaxID=2593673 RepID=UPI00345BD13C
MDLPTPAFDFADRPALPAGADPAQWRCEVLLSRGSIGFGRLGESDLALRLVFAEGRLAGEFAQVFGSLAAEPIRVRGGLPGPDGRELPLDLRVEHAGFADFLSVGDRMGEQHLKIRVGSPLLPDTCTIGDDADPIRLRPVRVGAHEVVSQDPAVLRFTAADTGFAVPAARGGGRLDRVVNDVLGLPSPAGANSVRLTTLVGLRKYSDF